MTGNFYDSQLIRIKIIKLITINEYQTRRHLSLMIHRRLSYADELYRIKLWLLCILMKIVV